jgi:hypothetical protein
MKNVPEKIYLHIDSEHEPTDDFNHLDTEMVYWSSRRQETEDIAYSLVDAKQALTDELFEKGIIPDFETPPTQEERKEFVEATIMSVAKPMMYTFYLLKLQTHIEGEIINDADGQKFRLKLEKVIE